MQRLYIRRKNDKKTFQPVIRIDTSILDTSIPATRAACGGSTNYNFRIFSKYYLEKFFFLKKYINFVLQMKKRLFLSVLFFCCVAALLPLMAQNTAAVEKHFLDDVMFSRGKINVVFSVVIIIVVGILGYWLYLHRQISKYSKNDKDNDVLFASRNS